jgi:hypothetical protein
VKAAKAWEHTVLQQAADWAWPKWRQNPEQYLKHALALELLRLHRRKVAPRLEAGVAGEGMPNGYCTLLNGAWWHQ